MLTALCPYRQLLSKCPPSIANGFDLILTKQIWANDRTRNESQSVGLGFIFCVAWRSYRFKHWLDEHVTKLRDEHWPTNKEACNKSSQSYRDLSSVQNPRWSSCPKCPGRSPPRHRWLVLGRWDGASCRVCVCVFQLGLGRDRSCQ